MRRLLFVLPLLFVAALAGLIWSLLQESDPTAFDRVELDFKPMISRPLNPLGRPNDFAELSAYLDGRTNPLVVNFFASWCVPCRAEHPYLMDLAAKGEVQIFGIAYKDKSEDTQRFLTELGNPYEIVLEDPDGRSGIDWGLNGVPETFVVVDFDAIAGKIKGPLVGETTIKRFESMLAEAAAR